MIKAVLISPAQGEGPCIAISSGLIKETFDYLSQHAGLLTPGQLELVKGLQRYHRANKELTEKQMNVLFEIRRNVPEAKIQEV